MGNDKNKYKNNKIYCELFVNQNTISNHIILVALILAV